jgi:hypothetical protein
MKWGDRFEVETGTFEKNSDMELQFRGTQRDCITPHHLFYLIREPGLILGKIRIPVDDQLPDVDEIKLPQDDEHYTRTMNRLAQQRWEESQ